ncbi:MAG TPA: ABC transporter ATP-binding protein, partial [Deltaproteobacteria bacterium]|nr:ABC transporter ATP-binding protein [Deltaproteobacteria bacterium]
GCSFHPRCRYRQDICRQTVPDLKEIQDGRFVACYFPRTG